MCFGFHFYVNISVLSLACVTVSALNLDFVDPYIIVVFYFSFPFELVDHIDSVEFFIVLLSALEADQ